MSFDVITQILLILLTGPQTFKATFATMEKKNVTMPSSLESMQNIQHHQDSSRHSRVPINITFENISYQVEVAKKIETSILRESQTKTILSSLSGSFRAGEVTAILGASGAGKTTLLNILACRVDHSPEGKVKANGKEYSFDNFGDFANYVMQTDVLMQTLTVRETLEFAAAFTIEGTKQEKSQRVEKMAKDFKLEQCLDTLIGGNLIKGCSGGQKKRTSIAFELMSDPQVIMLDQPTSGLDSLTSFIIVNNLKNLATLQKKTVLMTIHQPSNEIFEMFDRLLLMIEGGIVYQGPTSKAVDYFRLGFGLRCPEFTNPAEFFMQCLHQENPANVARYPSYLNTYRGAIEPLISQEIESLPEDQYNKRQVSIPWSSCFSALIYRDYRNMVKNPFIIKGRIIQTIVLGLYVGGLMFGAGGKDYTNYDNWFTISGFVFFAITSSMMQGLSPVVLNFPMDREVLMKEEGSKLYSLSSFFLSRTIIELPYIMIVPLIYCLIIYWMVSLTLQPGPFFFFYLCCCLMTLNGNSMGTLIGSLLSDPKLAGVVMICIMMPIMLFSGFFKNRDNLPVWIGWLEYLSPIKYGLTAALKSEVSGQPSLIGDLNLDVGQWESIGYLFLLAVGFKTVGLFFLWLFKTKMQ